MFCPNCGRKVQEGLNFCMYCGMRLAFKLESSPEEEVRSVIIRRIEAIKNKDPEEIRRLVDQNRYSKFDDWPPFELQKSEGISNEAKALKALKSYEYETRSWNIITLAESALATFIIRYRGEIRNLRFDIQSRVSVFLAKYGEKWKIIHEHWSRFPQHQPF